MHLDAERGAPSSLIDWMAHSLKEPSATDGCRSGVWALSNRFVTDMRRHRQPADTSPLEGKDPRDENQAEGWNHGGVTAVTE